LNGKASALDAFSISICPESSKRSLGGFFCEKKMIYWIHEGWSGVRSEEGTMNLLTARSAGLTGVKVVESSLLTNEYR